MGYKNTRKGSVSLLSLSSRQLFFACLEKPSLHIANSFYTARKRSSWEKNYTIFVVCITRKGDNRNQFKIRFQLDDLKLGEF
jgi:hypothetical protein